VEIFIARQPIFDSQKKLFGYELLFRNGLENAFPDIDGDTATSSVLSNTFFSFGLNEILDNKPGLINFTKKLILQKAPLLFPKENIIIEVLENIEPEEEILKALNAISQKGYTIALDDFVYQDKLRPMMRLCKMIKFDLIATPLEKLDNVLKEIRSSLKMILLAEKVETYAEFQKAKEMGFTLFQGYFFSKPEILSKRTIPSNHMSKIKLIREIQKTNIDYVKIENLIKQDVGISYKLIQFVNSAYFKRSNPISTLKDAITFLGTEELKKFIHIVVVSYLGQEKPNELLRLSIIRARMCESCGKIFKTGYRSEELFTMGLFSLIDAILDMSMDQILMQIGLPKNIQNGLLGKDEDFNTLLSAVKVFEKGNWATLDQIHDADELPRFYLDSVKMGNSFFD
jgi:EAL and modified HD-GYP domain-containing signal transduction protein